MFASFFLSVPPARALFSCHCCHCLPVQQMPSNLSTFPHLPYSRVPPLISRYAQQMLTWFVQDVIWKLLRWFGVCLRGQSHTHICYFSCLRPPWSLAIPEPLLDVRNWFNIWMSDWDLSWMSVEVEERRKVWTTDLIIVLKLKELCAGLYLYCILQYVLIECTFHSAFSCTGSIVPCGAHRVPCNVVTF